MAADAVRDDALQSLIKAAESAGDGLPPVEKWEPTYCGEMDLVIKRDGSWWHEGTRITRERLTRLFSTILRKDDDGVHYLVTPVEKIGIEVEVAPFLAVRVDQVEPDAKGENAKLIFTTNMGDVVAAGPDHPIRVETDAETGQPLPLVRVRGRLDALITRAAFYELVELAEAEGDRLVVSSDGAQFDLGTTA